MTTIKGRVLDHTGAAGIAGLRVQFADSATEARTVPSTLTGPEGAFELALTRARLGHGALTVFAPPARIVARQELAPNEESSITITLSVAATALISNSRTLSGKYNAPPGELTLRRVPGFVAPRVGNQPLLGRTGAPALPQQIQRIILPAGKRISGITAIPGPKQVVRLGTERPLPRQPVLPDIPSDPRYPAPPAQPRVTIQMDEALLRANPLYPPLQVEQGQTTHLGPLTQVELRLNPVRYNSTANAYEYTPELAYTVQLADGPPTPELTPLTENRAQLITQLVSKDNATLLAHGTFLRGGYPALDLVKTVFPYVIITDDLFWDAMQPDITKVVSLTPKAGSPLPTDADGKTAVFHFERLAQWKMMRGLGARVVLVTDIVKGVFGDMTNGGFALDLAEIIRNFIVYIQSAWQTAYVLIGGSVDVVPMRYLVGHITSGGGLDAWDCNEIPVPASPSSTTWPTRGCVTDTSTGIARLRMDFAGFNLPVAGTVLCRDADGLAIPHGKRSRGPYWFFTTSASFYAGNAPFDVLSDGTPDATAAPGDTAVYVVVEKLPAPDGNVRNYDRHPNRFYCVSANRMIPTDFYYGAAEQQKTNKSPVQHAFDDTGNHVYGQYRWNFETQAEEPVDGFGLLPHVWVGRAPVRSAADAAAFVDKVIGYERMDPLVSWTGYLERILLVADRWQHEADTAQFPSAHPDTSTPEAGHFSRPPGARATRIQCKNEWPLGTALKGSNPAAFASIDDTASNPARLFARFNDQDVLIPYIGAATQADKNASWCFADVNYMPLATSATAGTLNILVTGPSELTVPDCFFWDMQGVDGADDTKDALRQQMQGWYPGFSAVQRLYRDRYAYPYPISQTPTMTRLESDTVHPAIGDGAHFLSFTGHGWPGGCCDLYSPGDPDFANANCPSIAFANSCSTSVPDWDLSGKDSQRAKSMGEWLVTMKQSGAVAYVGNTQMGFTGPEDAGYESAFWRRLTIWGRLGPAALWDGGDAGSYIWKSYIQNLYGDPEMPVWLAPPWHYVVVAPSTIAQGATLEVYVTDGENPVADQYVTLLAGYVDSATPPELWSSVVTTPRGRASFVIPTLKASQITLVVSAKPEANGSEAACYVPFVKTLNVSNPSPTGG